jgi:integrase
VLDRPVEGLDNDVVRAKRPERLPVVLTPVEVRTVLAHLEGTPWLMASLLYGPGLRLLECLRFRVNDIDFGQNHIVVRDDKGMCVTTLIDAKPAIAEQAGRGCRESPRPVHYREPRCVK